jgi:hypothetical protein
VLTLADARGNAANVEVLGSAHRFPNSVKFLNDWIAVLHGVFPGGSSSGVQITGGLKPAERHASSMLPRIAAFAMCLQFQVNR